MTNSYMIGVCTMSGSKFNQQTTLWVKNNTQEV